MRFYFHIRVIEISTIPIYYNMYMINLKLTIKSMHYLKSIIWERCSLFMVRSAEFLMINIKNINIIHMIRYKRKRNHDI